MRSSVVEHSVQVVATFEPAIRVCSSENVVASREINAISSQS